MQMQIPAFWTGFWDGWIFSPGIIEAVCIEECGGRNLRLSWWGGGAPLPFFLVEGSRKLLCQPACSPVSFFRQNSPGGRNLRLGWWGGGVLLPFFLVEGSRKPLCQPACSPVSFFRHYIFLLKITSYCNIYIILWSFQLSKKLYEVS